MKYLVYGLGITGLSTLKTLNQMGLSAVGYDNDPVKRLQCEKMGFDTLEEHEIFWKDYHTLVKSPGIPPKNPLIIKAKEKNINVVSDLEMVTQLFPKKKVISITGTNGKTTCSTLVHFILSKCDLKVSLMGNIGIGMLWELYQNSDDVINIIETSSFQLHDTSNYHPFIAALLNINEDHLDWHADFQEYIQDKFKIFQNQGSSDFSVINIDDPIIDRLQSKIHSKKITVSHRNKNADYYYESKNLYYKGSKVAQLDLDHMHLKGEHNIQNIMIAIAICSIYGVDPRKAMKILRTFPGIPHRLEYVRCVNGIKFYNDSKGTNPDSTIKAVQSLDNIILIAGGYNKHIDLDPLFKVLSKRLKALILMGETKELFYQMALKYKIKNVEIVDGMKDGVNVAYNIAKSGDNILLSPASASWGMYNNFEERGDHFKQIVKQLR